MVSRHHAGMNSRYILVPGQRTRGCLMRANDNPKVRVNTADVVVFGGDRVEYDGHVPDMGKKSPRPALILLSHLSLLGLSTFTTFTPFTSLFLPLGLLPTFDLYHRAFHNYYLYSRSAFVPPTLNSLRSHITLWITRAIPVPGLP